MINVNRNEAKFWHAFNLIKDIGYQSFCKLTHFFPSLEAAWTASPQELKEAGFTPKALRNIQASRPKIDPDEELEKLERENIKFLTLKDQEYPALLKEIYDPPHLLYYRGTLAPEDKLSVGIVGTRRLSAYGKQITPNLAYDLASKGLTIVSGLAKGIDALAHKAALEAGGRTIAVLGTGIDQKSVYPEINKNLSEQIIQQGALVSEFLPGTAPHPGHFPKRNRIISGLSLGTLVIEAPKKSGALITTRNAMEQNREVFAVPGHILSLNSEGPNQLIKDGARLVEKANDILEELNLETIADQKQSPKQSKPKTPEEAAVLNCLSIEPLHIDKIIRQTKLAADVAVSTLNIMEIEGRIKNIGNNQYIKT